MKICEICKKEFTPNYRTISIKTGESRQKTCSFECSQERFRKYMKEASKRQHIRKMKLKLEEKYKGKGCLICSNKETVQNHHFIMSDVRKEDEEDTIPLCFNHHKIIHKYLRISKYYGYMMVKK